MRKRKLGNIFNNTGYALAAANACGHDSVFFVQPLHIINDLNREFGAGTSERMTECDGATIDIYF